MMKEWQKYETKDSGERVAFSTGMVRDTDTGKSRLDLCYVKGMPYKEQLLVRYGELRARGAEKYCETFLDVNCEKAETEEELGRFKSSAARHFAQWMCGEEDEDHASATLFNIHMAEMVEWKLRQKANEKEAEKASGSASQ